MTPTFITLDFETYYDDKYSLKKLTTLEYVYDERFKVHGVGIQVNDGEPYYVYNDTDVDDVGNHLKTLFPDGNTHTLLCHNTMFDALIMDIHYNVRAAWYQDTQLMGRGCNPHASSALAAMCEMVWPNDSSKRKGEELSDFSGMRDLTVPEQEKLGGYCNNDVRLTYDLYQELVKSYPDTELEIIHLTIKMWVVPNFILDQSRVAKHRDNVIAETAELVEASGVSQEVLASNLKFTDFLKLAFEIEVPTKVSPATGKVAPALGKNDVAFQELQRQKPELSHVWRARLAVKSTIEESRAKRLLKNAALDRGQIRVPLKYYGAHTGRASGGEKINLQNLKRGSELRRSLTAPKGHYVYVCDLSQIEARMLAWFAGETQLVEDFRDGVDIYSDFASGIYGRKINRKKEIPHPDTGKLYKPDVTEGHVGKVCVLGLGYNMGPGRFQDTLAQGTMGGPPVFFNDEESKHIVYTLYRGKYRAIVNSWAEGQKALTDMLTGNYREWSAVTIGDSRLVLPNGMALNYNGLQSVDHPDARDEFQYYNGKKWVKIYGGLLVENIMQALAADIIKQHMIALAKKFTDGNVALQVHDEIIVVMPSDCADERMAEMEYIMRQTMPWCSDLPIDCEGGYALDYSK